MDEAIRKIMSAKELYERALYDLNFAPRGFKLIDEDIKETYDRAKIEYKNQIIKTIEILAKELANME